MSRRAAPPPDAKVDRALVEVLEMPAGPGETIAVAYGRKELAVRQLFATLDVIASRAMHTRLVSPQPGDLVAERFGRMTAERRGRLLDFLADVRRRQAVAVRGAR